MYRFGPHTIADDPTVYRSEEVQEWKGKDPIKRFGQFLRSRDLLGDEKDDAIQEDIEDIVARAVEEAEAYEPNPDSMFEHVYAESPKRLCEQQYLNELRERHGDEELLA